MATSIVFDTLALHLLAKQKEERSTLLANDLGTSDHVFSDSYLPTFLQRDSLIDANLELLALSYTWLCTQLPHAHNQ